MATSIPAPSTTRGQAVQKLLRCTAVAALAAGMTVLGSAAAEAHVHVVADSTTSGSYSALTFRVPNESASASTVTVSVQLPQDTPFLSVRTKPVEGWAAKAEEAPLPQPVEFDGTTITKAVRTVSWTAEPGSEIGPGQYQEFSISVGPLPAAGTVLLPTVQTYSDGKVVSWDQPTPASGEEPEDPAPVLQVTTATGAGVSPAAAPAGASSDGTARGLAGGALVLALAALVVAVMGLRRRTATGRSA